VGEGAARRPSSLAPTGKWQTDVGDAGFHLPPVSSLIRNWTRQPNIKVREPAIPVAGESVLPCRRASNLWREVSSFGAPLHVSQSRSLQARTQRCDDRGLGALAVVRPPTGRPPPSTMEPRSSSSSSSSSSCTTTTTTACVRCESAWPWNQVRNRSATAGTGTSTNHNHHPAPSGRQIRSLVCLRAIRRVALRDARQPVRWATPQVHESTSPPRRP